MQQDKAKIKLSGASRSMLACLWGRAQLSKKYSSLFHDEKPIELVEKIDYDDLAARDDQSLQGLEMSLFRMARPLDLLDADMRRFMDYSDKQGSSYIIHLRV